MTASDRVSATEPLLVARALTREYASSGGSVLALDGLSLAVGAGEYLAVQGASGSGKTTLLNLLGGLDRPTSGAIRLGGEDLAQLSEAQLARVRLEGIGFVFQDFCLVSGLSAADNVRLPLVLAGRTRGSSRRAGELLEAVGLARRARHLPHELSRGEMQRVAIARALAADPEILLVDEPTANLDEAASAGVRSILRECAMLRGKAVVLATHDRDLASDAARVVVLSYGRFAD